MRVPAWVDVLFGADPGSCSRDRRRVGLRGRCGGRRASGADIRLYRQVVDAAGARRRRGSRSAT